MRRDKVQIAVDEANRFIAKAREWSIAEQSKKESYYMTPKESGFLRRASLDLSRALSDMRKP